jgi:hypothetical protein
MKKLTQLFATALFALAIGVGSASYAQEDHPGYATVVRVQGIASYTLGDGLWHPLVAGKKLMAGSTLRTGENGVVDVILGKQIAFPQSQGAPDRISQAPDEPVRGFISDMPSAQQNAVRLTPGTVLAINKLNINDTGVDTVSDTELDLQKGKIFGIVKKLSPASQYLVKIPNGIAGIRGTEYSLGADDTAACYASESGGLTVVLDINGQTYTFNIAPGEMLGLDNFNPGHPDSGKVGIPGRLESLLSAIFTQLHTTYHVTLNYDDNNNTLYISATTGTKRPQPPQPE